MSWNNITISGGHTGADRAALDFAINYETPHGGWCPKNRTALDGPLDPKYKLKETPSEDYLERIEWNVRDSDATVIFSFADKPSLSSKKTVTVARKIKKPFIHLHRGILGASEKLIAFIDKHYVRRLNITGSSEAEEPGLYDWVTQLLERTKTTMEKMGDR